MLVGFLKVIFWNTFLVSGGVLPTIAGVDMCIFDTGLYELVPAFILSIIVNILVSNMTGGPSAEIEAEFDEYQEILNQ